MEVELCRGCFTVLEETRVGCISTRRKLPEERDGGGHGGAGSGDEGEEGGPGPPDL